eukprot:6205802-Pleurochrysis_carterae.AAC.3
MWRMLAFEASQCKRESDSASERQRACECERARERMNIRCRQGKRMEANMRENARGHAND